MEADVTAELAVAPCEPSAEISHIPRGGVPRKQGPRSVGALGLGPAVRVALAVPAAHDPADARIAARPAKARPGLALGRLSVEEQALECLPVPTLEARSAPASIDDQQLKRLRAADRVQDVRSGIEVEALGQAAVADHDLEEGTLPREALSLPASPQLRDVRFGRSRASDHLVQGDPSLEDGAAVAGQDPKPAMYVAFVAERLNPRLVDDRRGLVAPCDRESTVGQDRSLGAERG